MGENAKKEWRAGQHYISISEINLFSELSEFTLVFDKSMWGINGPQRQLIQWDKNWDHLQLWAEKMK